MRLSADLRVTYASASSRHTVVKASTALSLLPILQLLASSVSIKTAMVSQKCSETVGSVKDAAVTGGAFFVVSLILLLLLLSLSLLLLELILLMLTGAVFATIRDYVARLAKV